MSRDDLDAAVELPRPPARVVSLVPSLTEAIATSCPQLLVGATDWCTHPADLDVARVRGTKNPHLAAIADLAPDLVVANKEENRELDVRRLRERGITVWVTDIEDVPSALTSAALAWCGVVMEAGMSVDIAACSASCATAMTPTSCATT